MYQPEWLSPVGASVSARVAEPDLNVSARVAEPCGGQIRVLVMLLLPSLPFCAMTSSPSCAVVT